MRFKKIYIEITNACNLTCKFCYGNKRKILFMSFDDFKLILSKIKKYTKYLYFHVLGEPLLHPKINEFIDYAYSQGFYINITTNGYLIKNIRDCSKIRQINFSLHSYSEYYKVDLEKYLTSIFDFIDNNENTYFSLRLWVCNDYNESIIKFISDRYNIFINKENNNFKVKDNVFLNFSHTFIWPDVNNNFYSEKGKCYGLIDHIGILSDGSIVPCCLDAGKHICLGNIYDDELIDILNTERVKKMIVGFRNNHRYEELCRHCGFFK